MDLKNYKITKIKNNLENKIIIAGPCSFNSFSEIYEIALELKEMGVEYLRGGAFKPRTSPYSFQGLGDKGMEYLLQIKKELNLKIVAELMNVEQVRKYGGLIDIIQIGARNMYNYDLLKEVGKTKTTVLLKRHFSATIEEWLDSAEYIAMSGNENIILCERGIRSFDKETRNVLDLQAVAIVKNTLNIPVVVDPSHASGRRDIIPSMCMAAMAAGADGLLIECHINPSDSVSDSEQAIDLTTLKRIQEQIKIFK